MLDVALKDALSSMPLETEIDGKTKAYVGVRDNKMVLEFWQVIEKSSEQCDWECVKSYDLKP